MLTIYATSTFNTTETSQTLSDCVPTLSTALSTTIDITLPPNTTVDENGCPSAVSAAFAGYGLGLSCKQVEQVAIFDNPPPPPPVTPIDFDFAALSVADTESSLPILVNGTDPAAMVTTVVATSSVSLWMCVACCAWSCCCLCRRRLGKQKPACVRDDVDNSRLVTVNIMETVRHTRVRVIALALACNPHPVTPPAF